MKRPSHSDLRAQWVTWLAFALVCALACLNAAVRVDFTEPVVPFAQAWASAEWGGPWRGEIPGELWLLTACLILFSLADSRKCRLLMVLAGFLVPVVAQGWVMLGVAAVSPLLIGSAVWGRVDGEFYGEGILFAASLGLWMLCCLGLAVRECLLMRRDCKPAGEPAGRALRVEEGILP